MKNESLQHKVVVITGASSGFGKGAALAFAREGARVVLAARRDQVLNDLVLECGALGGDALNLPTDVSNAREVETLAQAAIAQYDRIDVWINNAGIGALGPFERIPLEDHVQVIETNLVGTLYGMYYAYLRFLEQGHGILINVASELGRHTSPYYSSYTASKHGIVGLSDSLQQEIAQAGLDSIHVCTVLPTAHDTPFFDHVANYSGHEVQAPEPLHDPQDVVDALVRLARNPKDEDIVGRDGVFKILMKRLVPGLAEKQAAKEMHKTQIEEAPPAGDTSGAVHFPMDQGTEVSGGRRKP